jgi:hypothetical protein
MFASIRTMLLHLSRHDVLLTHSFANGGKKVRFLVIMVLLDAPVPREAVSNERLVIRRGDPRSVLVYSIKSTDESVMAQNHMGCFLREGISLKGGLKTLQQLIKGSAHDLACTVLRSLQQSQWSICM